MLLINFYNLFFISDNYTKFKVNLSRFSGGISYLGRLNLWQSLVLSNDWLKASALEIKLDQNQVNQYKSDYQASSLYKKLAQIINKPDKDADDYLDIAKIYTLLDQTELSNEAIKKAHQLDPIRADIDKLFYQLQ